MPLEDAFLQCPKDNFKTKEYSKRGAMEKVGSKGKTSTPIFEKTAVSNLVH